jgi:hypothetical protein
MRLKTAVATLALLSLPVSSAMADPFWRNVLSSGATTGSSYLTFKDHKLIIAAQYLEAAIQKVRAQNPDLQASDMDLANAILAKNAVAEN